MRRFIAAVAAACALAAAVPAAFASSFTAQSANFADTTAGIHLWAPIHEPGGRFASQADAVAAARRYDLITIRIGQLDSYTAAMRAANPKLRIYVYVNGTYLYKANRSQVSASILAHTATGALVQSNGFGNYLGTPTNTGWIAYKQKECQSAIAATGADGCYLDMLGSAPTMPGYNTGLPINPATGKVWTKSEWLHATAALAGKVSAYVGKPMLGNGFGNGPRYFDATAPSKMLLAGAVGSTAEAWLKAPAASATAYETESLWKKDVDLLGDANAAGGMALAMTKTGAAARRHRRRPTACMRSRASCSATPASPTSTSRRTRPTRPRSIRRSTTSRWARRQASTRTPAGCTSVRSAMAAWWSTRRRRPCGSPWERRAAPPQVRRSPP
jgi:hypothetical protein